MNRYKTHLLVSGVFLLASFCIAQPPDELAYATRGLGNTMTVEIPNTRSPGGRYALFSISTEGTAGVTGIATTDRKTCLAITSVFQYGLNYDDRKPTSYLTVLWSSDGTYAAIHDSARKHSRLEVYALSDGARKIDVAAALAQAALTETLVSSGEEPLKWIGNTALVVECRGKRQSGNVYRKSVTVDIANHTANKAIAGGDE